MQTVQLQCGSCSNMMAISVEHLGAQVQCPHCSAVVQTPPRSALGPLPGPDPEGAAVQPAPPPPPPPTYQQPTYQQPTYQPPAYQPPAYQPPAPSIQVPERESIFSEPEPSDDLFGGDNSPKVQIPDAAYSAQAPAPVEQSVAVAEEEDEEQADLRGMRSRMAQERKASSFAPTLLVFLVPYAIFTTAFLAYLLMTWPKIEHFEWLPDPKGGGKKNVMSLPQHDLPMPAKLKTPLGQPIRVGQMEITPLTISKTAAGDLVLAFKAKNYSDAKAIVPIERLFFAESKGNARPFTFLETFGRDSLRIYGGDLDFFTADGKKTRLESNELQPGRECIVELTTGNGPSTRKTVAAMLAQNGRLQWRLQFRRGTYPVHGVEQMLTAVIAVEFANKDVS